MYDLKEVVTMAFVNGVKDIHKYSNPDLLVELQRLGLRFSTSEEFAQKLPEVSSVAEVDEISKIILRTTTSAFLASTPEEIAHAITRLEKLNIIVK